MAAQGKPVAGRTLYDKVWDAHVVGVREDGQTILYIDQQLLHEVTSPQAFEGLKLAGRKPWRVGANLATPDHNVPTDNRGAGIDGILDLVAREQVETLDRNCREYGITQFDILDRRQGIVHVVGPEQGATLPGMTIVCGDSHTSTHGAFAALAQGVGTSDVEFYLHYRLYAGAIQYTFKALQSPTEHSLETTSRRMAFDFGADSAST